MDVEVSNDMLLRIIMKKIDKMSGTINEISASMQEMQLECSRERKIENLENEIINLKILFKSIKEKEAEIDQKLKKKINDEYMLVTDQEAEQLQNFYNYKEMSSCSEKNLKEIALVAFRGKNWNGHNIHNWLERTLNLKFPNKTWDVFDVNPIGTVKKVIFQTMEDRDYIWHKIKSEWKDENIWLWDEYLKPEEIEIKNLLKKFGKEQELLNKKVLISNKFIIVNNEKYVYNQETNEIVKDKVAKLVKEMKIKNEEKK